VTQFTHFTNEFNVHGTGHRNNILIFIQQNATLNSLFYLETAASVNITLSITVGRIPDVVDTVVCAPDDG
jgi:hypothetical protein